MADGAAAPEFTLYGCILGCLGQSRRTRSVRNLGAGPCVCVIRASGPGRVVGCCLTFLGLQSRWLICTLASRLACVWICIGFRPDIFNKLVNSLVPSSKKS